MTTYAIPQTVPDDCDYLTAGKRYRVEWENPQGSVFAIMADDGILMNPLWEDSSYLNGGNWTRVEGDDE